MARSAKDLQVFKKNVQTLVQKRVPENWQQRAKTLFSTTFLEIPKTGTSLSRPWFWKCNACFCTSMKLTKNVDIRQTTTNKQFNFKASESKERFAQKFPLPNEVLSVYCEISSDPYGWVPRWRIGRYQPLGTLLQHWFSNFSKMMFGSALDL